MTVFKRAIFSTALLFLAACQAKERAALPLPQLPTDEVPLRVAYVVNPRLPQMTTDQLQVLLDSMREASKDNFGITIKFSKLETLPITQLIERIPADTRKSNSKYAYDFRNETNSANLEAAFGREFEKAGESLPDMIAYSRPYLGELPAQSYLALGSALAKYQLKGIDRWRQIPALDGEPSIDATDFHEYRLWSALEEANLPYELILTNQLIASVETIYPSAHSALRGGYTNGITIPSHKSRYGTLSVWSTFAFTANDAWTTQLRGGERYEPLEAAQLAGWSGTHELGHQLFHFSHPYTNRACIMYPVQMLEFRRWRTALSPKKCAIGSSPEMTPGAHRFIQ